MACTGASKIKKWKAFSTQKKHLGFYDSPVQAAVAYDEAERELQKENCGNSKVKLNFLILQCTSALRATEAFTAWPMQQTLKIRGRLP